MGIIGRDFHPSWQQVAWLDRETGETGEQKLVNGNGEAEGFYCSLPEPALVGAEACGNSQWFIELLQQMGHEVWVGDAAQIRASYVRKQKTDKRDAAHILKLLVEGRFPKLWVPSAEQRDVRQLLIHRHKLVEIRTRVKNGLQHLAMNRGIQKKSRLRSAAGQKALRELPLQGWAGRRRQDLLGLLKNLDEQVGQLDQAVEETAQRDKMAQLLRTQPGVGSITALAFVVTIGDVTRFRRGKQVASYLGLIPRERSSGGRQRLGRSASRATGLCAPCWWKRRTAPTSGMRDFARPISSAAIAWRKAWPRWQRQESWQYDSTGCCAPTPRIRDRWHREQPAGAPGQQKLDRGIDWALSPPVGDERFA